MINLSTFVLIIFCFILFSLFYYFMFMCSILGESFFFRSLKLRKTSMATLLMVLKSLFRYSLNLSFTNLLLFYVCKILKFDMNVILCKLSKKFILFFLNSKCQFIVIFAYNWSWWSHYYLEMILCKLVLFVHFFTWCYKHMNHYYYVMK